MLCVSWWKPHANGVIHKSPGSDCEAVATPGIDRMALELQGSSTNRPDHPKRALLHPCGHFRSRPRFVELASEFWPTAHLPRVAARTSPYPGLLCMTPLASEHSRGTRSTPINLTRMRTCGTGLFDAFWRQGTEISCKMEGLTIALKACFVKKVTV